MLNYLRLLRIKHWIKNLLVFAPLIFAFRFDFSSFVTTAIVLLVFSLFASSTYVLNDIFDYRYDRLHPAKNHRPIASGNVKIWQAFLLLIVLLSLATYLSTFVKQSVYFGCAIYFILNISYSLKLKHIEIIDAMIIAVGYVLRVVVGALALGVVSSHWLLLCTFFLALFLAFGKRKSEMNMLAGGSGGFKRRSIIGYSENFINQIITLTAGFAVVFYALYTIDPGTIMHFGTDRLIYTTPLVVFAVFRYFYLLYNGKEIEDQVEMMSSDKQIILAILFWFAAIILIYYSR